LVDSLNNTAIYDNSNTINSYFNVISSEENYSLFDDKLDSPYYDLECMINKYSNTDIPIVLSINIQSLASKFDELSAIINHLENNNVSIIAIVLQEVWNIKHLDTVIMNGFQNLSCKIRTFSNGGGVGIYVKNGTACRLLNIPDSFTDKLFESITVELNVGKHKYIISSIYRSPSPVNNMTQSMQIGNFIDKLDAFLGKINEYSNLSYVFLDSNIDLRNMHSSPANEYSDIILSNGFVQCITKDTRIHGNSHSLIDHILTNNICVNPKSGVLISDVSDHFFTFCELQKVKKCMEPKACKKRLFTEQNILNFKNGLRNLSWVNVTGVDNVDDSFKNFWNDFYLLYDLNFPYVKFKFNKNHHKKKNFMTSGLLTSRARKNHLHKLSLTEPTPDNCERYKNYRNLYNKLIRAMKQLHYEKDLAKYQKNPKKTWELLKEVSTGNKSTSKIEKINSGGVEVTDNKAMAEEFNNFFTEVGMKISGSILPPNRTAESYLDNNPNIPIFELNPVVQSHIIDIVKCMDAKSSLDSDGISTKLLKNIVHEISIPLAHVFSLSINQGIFPSKLKTARVVPIFKSGDMELTNNYRPISLLSSISKILEKVVSVQLYNHLDINKLLYMHQYGFQRNKSTEHNLLSAVNFIYDALNKGEYCIGLFLDLKKAFDVCDHEILISKLHHMGVRDTALNWFRSYLSNRCQYVEVNGAKSSKKFIRISVMQGSILGPLLFLCYINDLYKATSLFTLMFADDTSAFKSGKNLNTLINDIESELNKIAIWFRANKMCVNVDKTKFIIFRTRGKHIDENISIQYNANEPGQPFNENLVYNLERIHDGHTTKSMRAYKLLGIHLDEYLSFNYHVNFLCNKLSKALYCINRAKNLLSTKSLKLLYFALFHSHLNYCPIILNCTSDTNKERIFKMQKKAIRTITKSKYNAHTEPLFKEAKIMTFYNIIFMSSALFMHSYVYEYAPVAFNNVWSRNINRNYNLRNNDDFIVPAHRIELFKKSPLFSLPNLWNNLDDNRYQQNPVTFKWAMKCIIFDNWRSAN